MLVLFVSLYSVMSALQVSIVGGVTVQCWEWGSVRGISKWRYDILLSKRRKLVGSGNG